MMHAPVTDMSMCMYLPPPSTWQHFGCDINNFDPNKDEPKVVEVVVVVVD